jgi:pyruvate/2-oxoglutarate/acetoin dehydrogenase E1 component
VERCRKGEGPFFIELMTYRYHGHHVGDINREYYRSKDEEAEVEKGSRSDHQFGKWLIAEEDRPPTSWSPSTRRSKADAEAAVEIRAGRANIRIREVDMHVFAGTDHALTWRRRHDPRNHPVQGRQRGHRRGDAPRPTIFIIGEDVAEAGTPFKVLSGLVEEFGTDRVIDTPISEPGFMGIAVGAAMTGSRPIVDLMFGDFSILVMDQLCNQAAKTHYMSGGKLKVPLVLRTNLGATRRSAAQHSAVAAGAGRPYSGLKVALPSSAYEAKGLMKTAIRDNNPVVIFEDKLMYKDKAPVPEEEYLIPFGEANVKREGRDITLVATSSMVQVAEKAADPGKRRHQSPRSSTRAPSCRWTRRRSSNSVRKTSRAIVIDEGHQSYGVTARSPRGSARRRSTISTRRCCAWAPWTCRCRSRRRWRT